MLKASAKSRSSGKTVMSHYLDDPELTAKTIVDGWLLTGDLGRFDRSGHLQLFGRKKNMIVTEGGKNIYPEDIETVSRVAGQGVLHLRGELHLAAKESRRRDAGPGAALEQGQEFDDALKQEIVPATTLPDFKRVGGYVVWERIFLARPR